MTSTAAKQAQVAGAPIPRSFIEYARSMGPGMSRLLWLDGIDGKCAYGICDALPGFDLNLFHKCSWVSRHAPTLVGVRQRLSAYPPAPVPGTLSCPTYADGRQRPPAFLAASRWSLTGPRRPASWSGQPDASNGL